MDLVQFRCCLVLTVAFKRLDYTFQRYNILDSLPEQATIHKNTRTNTKVIFRVVLDDFVDRSSSKLSRLRSE